MRRFVAHIVSTNRPPTDLGQVVIGITCLSVPVIVMHLASVFPVLNGQINRFSDVIYGMTLAAIVFAQGLPGSFIHFQF